MPRWVRGRVNYSRHPRAADAHPEEQRPDHRDLQHGPRDTGPRLSQLYRTRAAALLQTRADVLAPETPPLLQ